MLNLVPLEQTRSFKEGEQSGEWKGELKKARDIARNLLQEGMGVETVARVTGLTIEEVRAIAS